MHCITTEDYKAKLSDVSDLELSSSSEEDDDDVKDKDIVLPALTRSLPGVRRKRGRPPKNQMASQSLTPFDNMGGLLMPGTFQTFHFLFTCFLLKCSCVCPNRKVI